MDLFPEIREGFDKKIDKEISEIVKRQLNVKNVQIKNGKEISVELDTNLTPELESEGFAREISRVVQAFRKELGLKKENKIELVILTDADFRKILESQKEFIQERTNSKKFEVFSENVTTIKEKFKNRTEFKVKDKRGFIAITYKNITSK